MKYFTLLLAFMIYVNGVNAQEKTIDRILDNTKGVLDIINKKTEKDKQSITTEKALDTTKELHLGKLEVKNSTQKRITVNIKLISEIKEYSKQYVLSGGDVEIFRNLILGNYEYMAKFEDGTVAKSGEFQITAESKSIEKEIK